MRKQAVFFIGTFFFFACIASTQPPDAATLPVASDAASLAAYVLGPDDQLNVQVLDLEEIGGKDNNRVVRVDLRGNINLPLIGRVHAEGLTVEQLENELTGHLKDILQNPQVTVSIADFRSHPVSVLGSVKTPGVQQVHGPKTLFEVVSLAGGLNPEAGNKIYITRAKSVGPLPLPDAMDDSTGQFSIASVSVKAVMDAKNPEENIEVMSNDVISVPKGDLVYVVGAVRKAGGFVLSEKDKISVLQALSLAEGLDKDAAPKSAKVLREMPNTTERTEIAINLKEILEGKAEDVPLLANDILFIPTAIAKSAGLRSLEIAVQMATGIAVYRVPF